MIQIRHITDFAKDWAVIGSWWERHQFPTPPVPALEKSIGLIAEHNGHPICCGFIFTASIGGMAWMEWLCSNPAATPMKVALGLTAICEFAKEETFRRGYAVCFSSIRQPSLGRILEKAGFQKADENMTHYVAIVRPAPAA